MKHWRGQIEFIKYIPNKIHKYGVKVFQLCAVNGNSWNTKIYSGKPDNYDKSIGLRKSVCIKQSSLHNPKHSNSDSS